MSEKKAASLHLWITEMIKKLLCDLQKGNMCTGFSGRIGHSGRSLKLSIVTTKME